MPRSAASCRYPGTMHGFTLLELVLVLFILAILTGTTIAFLENEDSQFRYEASIRKLDLIGDALLRERELQGATALSGFLSDNGSLYAEDTLTGGMVSLELQPLYADDTAWSDAGGDSWLEYAAQTPHYDTGTELALDTGNNPQYRLFKGYRGPYLQEGLDSDGEFLDGWGEPYDINTPASNVYEYTFDATTALKPDDFTDITRKLTADDWTVDPQELVIRIINNSGADITETSHEFAVTVFNNDSVATAAERWNTFHFTIPASASPLSDGNEYVTTAGTTWEYNGAALAGKRLPVGKHLVIAIDPAASEVKGATPFLVVPKLSNQPEVILTVDS